MKHLQKMNESPFTRRLLIAIFLAIVVTTYLGAILIDDDGINKMFHRTVFLVYVMTALVALEQSRFKPLKHPIILSLVISTIIGVSCNYYYGTSFNDAFAWSLIKSNPTEIWGMLFFLWPALLAAITMYATTTYAVKLFSTKILAQERRTFNIFLLIFTIYSAAVIADSILKEEKLGVKYGPISSALRKTPLYNISYILDARVRNSYLMEAAKIKIDHHYTSNGKNISKIIVIIGESAKKSNHSLYGYEQPTTPRIDKRKDSLIVFRNAVSPAAYTLMSVPLSLSSAESEPQTFTHLFDTVIDVAKHVGYEVTWISMQGAAGPDDTTITGIANKANQIHWLNGYDEKILAELKKSLDQSSKQLIFIHINGSHEPPCDRLPIAPTPSGNENKEDACYDGTIRYTDFIINDAIDLISDKNAALLYFSDHGLIKRKGLYLHAPGIPPKEAVDVPQYIYVASKSKDFFAKSDLNHLYSTTDNYYVISDLLGVYVDDLKCRSPLSGCYDFSRMPKVLDTSGGIHNYVDLKNTN